MKNKTFLSAGEFARICGTTKETILHYDRKGALKPGQVAKNGYRRYRPEQYFDFELISLLKTAGCSLREIKQYLAKNVYYPAMLKDKISILRQEQERLFRRIGLLAKLVDMAEEAASARTDEIFFEEKEAEPVWLYPVNPAKMLSLEGSIECYSECLLHSIANGGSLDLPAGVVIPHKEAQTGNFKLCYFFSQTQKDWPMQTEGIQPGKYACMFHSGEINSHLQAFTKLVKEIFSNGLTILGDVYAFDQMSYLLLGAGPAYIAKYVVRIG